MNITLESKTILITGAAGFIGSFLAKRLLEQFSDVNKNIFKQFLAILITVVQNKVI